MQDSHTPSLESMHHKIQMLDEKFIKFLVNKKLNTEDKKYCFLRIYYTPLNDRQESFKSYKTVGFEGCRLVEEVIELARKKYRLNETDTDFDLYKFADGNGIFVFMFLIFRGIVGFE